MLIISALVLCIFTILVFVTKQKSQPEAKTFSGSHEVTLSINPEYIRETEVSLLVDGQIQIFGVVPDVYTSHYHPAEFVDGNLYIIRRIGNTNTDNWNDQLWKYQTADEGVVLAEKQGLDFRVSSDGNTIAVFAGSFPSIVQIINSNGDDLKILETGRLALSDDSSLEYLAMTDDSLWLGSVQGIGLMNVYAYTFGADELRSWDVSELKMNSHEYAMNTDVALVAFSDYQFAFDTDSEKSLEDIPNALFLYNLEDGSKRLLVTSKKRHAFEPEWVNASTIEFNDIDGEGRTQIVTE